MILVDTSKFSTISEKRSEQKMKWTGAFVISMQGALPRALRGSESAELTLLRRLYCSTEAIGKLRRKHVVVGAGKPGISSSE